MKTIIWGNLGLLLGALYALGVGFLELRRIAINGGAIVSFDNEVTRLVLPTHGAPQLIGIAAASLLAIIAASAVFHILPLSAAIAYGAQASSSLSSPSSSSGSVELQHSSQLSGGQTDSPRGPSAGSRRAA